MTGLPAADSAYFNAEVETMSRADLEARQLERLLGVIPIAYERAPLIREAWEAARVHPRDIRSLDDFREREVPDGVRVKLAVALWGERDGDA